MLRCLSARAHAIYERERAHCTPRRAGDAVRIRRSVRAMHALPQRRCCRRMRLRAFMFCLIFCALPRLLPRDAARGAQRRVARRRERDARRVSMSLRSVRGAARAMFDAAPRARCMRGTLAAA